MLPDSIKSLISSLERLTAMFADAALAGYPSGNYAAEAIRRRIVSLRERIQKGDQIEIASRLLDMVPNAKDLDAIGFDTNAHPEISKLIIAIDKEAAELSYDYLPEE